MKLPIIFFITPTYYRPAQKADLVRLVQTLAHVSNLYWLVVEDTEKPSSFISEISQRSKITSVHLTALTPSNIKLKISNPIVKFARGIYQRNKALQWIR